MSVHFKNRHDAGRRLAELLVPQYRGADTIVYALPRGGVVLGYEIAKALNARLNLVITRKIGHPMNPEYAVCAVTESGTLLCDENEHAALDTKWFREKIAKEREEAKRRRDAYLGGRPPRNAAGRVAIVVDDGIATGLTFRLALMELKAQKPEILVAAVPVLPADTEPAIRELADDLVALSIDPHYRGAVGAYYDEFLPVDDTEVIELLRKANGK